MSVKKRLHIAGLIILGALSFHGIFYLVSFLPDQLFKILVGLVMGIIVVFIFVVELIEIVFPIEERI